MAAYNNNYCFRPKRNGRTRASDVVQYATLQTYTHARDGRPDPCSVLIEISACPAETGLGGKEEKKNDRPFHASVRSPCTSDRRRIGVRPRRTDDRRRLRSYSTSRRIAKKPTRSVRDLVTRRAPSVLRIRPFTVRTPFFGTFDGVKSNRKSALLLIWGRNGIRVVMIFTWSPGHVEPVRENATGGKTEFGRSNLEGYLI